MLRGRNRSIILLVQTRSDLLCRARAMLSKQSSAIRTDSHQVPEELPTLAMLNPSTGTIEPSCSMKTSGSWVGEIRGDDKTFEKPYDDRSV